MIANRKVPVYRSVRAHHTSNAKLGEVLVYYKNYLPLKLIEICNFLSLYRSPSQNRDEFEKILEHLELSIAHMADKIPYMMVALVDFDAKSNSWYANDTNIKGLKIDILTATFGFNKS